MARKASCRMAVLLLVALMAQQATAYYMTYPDLNTTALTGQWTIAVEATKTADKTVFEPQICNATDLSAPCLQPLLSNVNGDALKFTYTIKNAPLKTLGDLPTTDVIFKACYTQPFQKDRAWRRATPEIHKDRSCPVVLSSGPLNRTTYDFTYKIPNNTTMASWYAAVYVKCSNGTSGSGFCQYDVSKQVLWGTTQIQPITTGLKIGTAVCSLIAPLFLGSFFLWEFVIKKQS